jgi:hypothetical protein
MSSPIKISHKKDPFARQDRHPANGMTLKESFSPKKGGHGKFNWGTSKDEDDYLLDQDNEEQEIRKYEERFLRAAPIHTGDEDY